LTWACNDAVDATTGDMDNIAGGAGRDAGANRAGDASIVGDTDDAGSALTPLLPEAPASCPAIEEGELSVLGQQVKIWTGPPGTRGPLVFYWHGTGNSPEEALEGLGPGVSDIRTNGGVIASFSTTTRSGENTGNGVWHVGDFEMADIILACAVMQGVADAERVYTAGCSAGGLQAAAMVFARSGYLAAAMPNSGGALRDWPLQDSAHVPALISTHGGPQDFVIISFGLATARLGQDVVAKGGFAVNCDHGGGHCDSPPSVKRAQWEFLMAHPFGVQPEPYADGLPASFPGECQIVR
jgi:predicted esterase